MNKLLSAIALGAGLTLTLAVAPPAHASAIQPLDPQAITASQFGALFQPVASAPALDSNYQYLGAPSSGVVRSEVFQGLAGTAAEGLYAYAYQLGVSNVTTALGEPVHTDSASFQFGATPLGVDLLQSGKTSYVYDVTDGAIGGLVPPQAAPGDLIQTARVSWQPGEKIGTIRADFVNPATDAQPLEAGADSSTFVVLSHQPFTQQFVGLQSSNPTVGAPPAVYSATGGTISPVPLPEPTTILAWAGMAGATLLVRRVRRARARA